MKRHPFNSIPLYASGSSLSLWLLCPQRRVGPPRSQHEAMQGGHPKVCWAIMIIMSHCMPLPYSNHPMLEANGTCHIPSENRSGRRRLHFPDACGFCAWVFPPIKSERAPRLFPRTRQNRQPWEGLRAAHHVDQPWLGVPPFTLTKDSPQCTDASWAVSPCEAFTSS